MGRTVVRPAARRDLVRHFAYLGENAGIATARRFQQAARFTFDELAGAPRLGTPGKVAKFPELRLWRVRGFEKYLILYHLVGKNVVRIERVIHAAQDYSRVLDSKQAR